MDTDRRSQLFARYRDGYGALSVALAGITEAELDTRPSAGEWSVREIVHHAADTEMITAIRLRRLVAENNPAIDAYDEAEYARRLHYHDRPVGPSLEAVRAAVESTSAILERLTESEWARPGFHAERGPYSPEIALEFCASHLHDHAAQILRARSQSEPRP